jgi:nicotinamidase-related amidase
LDIQLRRRGIDTIVLCGIATNIGVESTAREAFQHGYNQIFITDAMTTFTKEEHEASLTYIFPRIGQLRTTEEFLSRVK